MMSACSYFSSRFPNLLMATFCFGLHRCAEEPMLAKYYPAGAREFPLELMSTRLAAATGMPATAANTPDAIRVQHPAFKLHLFLPVQVACWPLHRFVLFGNRIASLMPVTKASSLCVVDSTKAPWKEQA